MRPIKVFIAYAREDRAYVDTLLKFLAPLRKSNRLKVWYDGEIIPGTEWEQDIKNNLGNADIILLLMSAESLSSDYFYDKEMAEALERHEAETSVVIPVILRYCSWEDTPMSELQALPDNAKPVKAWIHESAAYKSIVDGIKDAMQMIKEREEAIREKKRKEEEYRKRLEAERKKRKEEEARKHREAEERKRRDRELQKQREREKLEEERRKRKEDEEWKNHEIEELKRRQIEIQQALNRDKALRISRKSEEAEREKVGEENRNQGETKHSEQTKIELQNGLKRILVKARAGAVKNYVIVKKYTEKALKFDFSNNEALQIEKEASEILDQRKQKIVNLYKVLLYALYAVASITVVFGILNWKDSQQEDIKTQGKPPPTNIKYEPTESLSSVELFPEPIQRLLNDMVFVEGGTFNMGCTREQVNCQDDEKPIHEVILDNFNIGKYEITQDQWEVVMGNNPSHFKECGSQCPVEKVGWKDVQDFIQKIDSITNKRFRLPTEAEWEYAARGGNVEISSKYAGTDVFVSNVGWCSHPTTSSTHKVGAKKSNELGLYDMSGNVWEWCDDWYSENYYKNSPRNNPQGPSTAQTYRVIRGGSWSKDFNGCRVSLRSGSLPLNTYRDVGFRLAQTLE